MSEDRFREEKVRNFYYLLAYAFEYKNISFEKKELFGTEKFYNICDLFSVVIFECMKEIMQKGLYGEYINLVEKTQFIKGRIDIRNTICFNTLRTQRKVICNYDEYTINNLYNQIIKTTIKYILKTDIMNDNRVNLKKIYNNLENIDIISDWKNIRWDAIKFNKLNDRYEFIINICRFVLNNLIINKELKSEKIEMIDDESQTYHQLFEKFIRNYLKLYYQKYRQDKIFDLNIKSENMKWNIDENKKNINQNYIPNMHTDISIEKKEVDDKIATKVKIIDAKFYSNVLTSKGFNGYKKDNINRDNLYQIYSYVSNKKYKIEKELENCNINKEADVSGMLLYAQTKEVKLYDFEVDVSMMKNRIQVKIIDFTQKFGNPYNPEENTIVWQIQKLAEEILEELK